MSEVPLYTTLAGNLGYRKSLGVTEIQTPRYCRIRLGLDAGSGRGNPENDFLRGVLLQFRIAAANGPELGTRLYDLEF